MDPRSELILLKASAGSGKTTALARRYLAFALGPGEGDERGRAALSRILAVTFTRNAAREMKARILGWLKDCRLGDEERLRDLSALVELPARELSALAGRTFDRIIDEYSDFQVSTIDSFMASVFRASAVDLGVSPGFEIALDNGDLIGYALSSYLRTVRPGTRDEGTFLRILDDLARYQRQGAGFPWDPTPGILDKLTGLYTRLAARRGELARPAGPDRRPALCRRIVTAHKALEAAIEASGLERNRQAPYATRIAPAIADGRFADLVEESFKTLPVRKAGEGPDGASARIARLFARLEVAVRDYASLYAREFFAPYLKAFRAFEQALVKAKSRRGVVFIEDLGRDLARYLDAGIVPDVYFRLGDRIAHFLVDEFQDTSPIQWENLKPLIEESLAKGGSLFAVGDTKQAIYGFREADFRIMKGLADALGPDERAPQAPDREGGADPFPSAEIRRLEELPLNYRCQEAVLDFVKRVFPGRRAGRPEEAGADEESRYAACMRLSGLDDYTQEVAPANRDKGYVEVVVLSAPDGEAAEGGDEDQAGEGRAPDDGGPEKPRVQELVRELAGRGYAYSDIAILAARNESVVRAASWLNEIGVPFVPYSRLDIRRRKVVAEILAFLRFLDAPPDDLSFAAFLLGDVLAARLARDGDRSGGPGEGGGRDALHQFLFECRQAGTAPLYPAFRSRFPGLWDRYFERAFRAVGIYPLYDLVTLVYRLFDVFALFPEEEAALARLLEAIKAFEGQGRNDIREFLVRSAGDDDESAWTMDIPADLDAVRIMSIHKAKGLGFPVVILLLYGEAWQPPDYFLAEDGAGVKVLKITAKLAACDPELAGLYEAQKQRDWAGTLNALYVAMTRARAELYLVGVRRRRDRYPFDLLDAAIGGDRGARPPGGVLFRSSEAKPPASRPAGRGDRPAAPLARTPGVFDLPPNTRESLNTAGVRRGETVHRVLARIELVERGWEEEIAGAAAGLAAEGVEPGLLEEAGRAILAYLPGSPLEPFFRPGPGRAVLREAEFCDAAGRLVRMDRVVIDPGSVTVVDFKTGAEPGPAEREARDEDDRAQIRDYAALLRELYPGRRVRGILSRIDRRTEEEAA